MLRLRFRLPLSMIAVAGLAACGNTDVNESGPERISRLREFVAEISGHAVDEVMYSEAERDFTIDGDAKMRLEDAEARLAERREEGVLQRAYTYLISQTNVRNIRVCVDGTVPSEWNTLLDTALQNWNSSASAVNLYRVSCSETYHLFVTSYHDSSTSTVAYAYLPNGSGNVGQSMHINTAWNSLSSSQKVFALTHELGHNLGLMHTNSTSGNLIPGTTDNDPNSVMNSFVLSWAGFTTNDLTAIRYLYPASTSSPSPAPSPSASPSPKPSPSPSPAPSASPSPVADVTPPTVAITAPTAGTRVARGQKVTLQASASDNVKVSRVVFAVNGSQVCEDFSSPYSCSWKVPNSRNVPASYRIDATAFDSSGNSSRTSISVYP